MLWHRLRLAIAHIDGTRAWCNDLASHRPATNPTRRTYSIQTDLSSTLRRLVTVEATAVVLEPFSFKSKGTISSTEDYCDQSRQIPEDSRVMGDAWVSRIEDVVEQ
jgi:hypothetical protein